MCDCRWLKPALLLGCRLWGFFQKWIYETCMYIVFIKIIYVVSRKKQRTIQCRLYWFAKHAVVFDGDRETWVKQKVYLVFPEAPESSQTQYLFPVGTSMGINLFWTPQLFGDNGVDIYFRDFFKTKCSVHPEKGVRLLGRPHTCTHGWHTPWDLEQHVRPTGARHLGSGLGQPVTHSARTDKLLASRLFRL